MLASLPLLWEMRPFWSMKELWKRWATMLHFHWDKICKSEMLYVSDGHLYGVLLSKESFVLSNQRED